MTSEAYAILHSKVTKLIGAFVLTATIAGGAYTYSYVKSPKMSIAASIVKVLNPEGTSGGTGWIAMTTAGQSVIVTNDHVCAVSTNGSVRVDDDNGIPALKKILSRNFERDLCLIDTTEGPALNLAKNGPARFEEVFVMGHPLLGPTTPSKGFYTGTSLLSIGTNTKEDGTCPPSTKREDSLFGSFCVLVMELSTTTAPIYPGSSGSPILNSKGEVIGVVNSTDQTNRGNFIPLTYLREMLNYK